MNKRTEHEGITNRYPQAQHTGPIPPGVGFPTQGGGGIICDRVIVDGVQRALPLTDAVEIPEPNQVTMCFDKDKVFLGEFEHLQFGEWYRKGGEQVEGVAFWFAYI